MKQCFSEIMTAISKTITSITSWKAMNREPEKQNTVTAYKEMYNKKNSAIPDLYLPGQTGYCCLSSCWRNNKPIWKSCHVFFCLSQLNRPMSKGWDVNQLGWNMKYPSWSHDYRDDLHDLLSRPGREEYIIIPKWFKNIIIPKWFVSHAKYKTKYTKIWGITLTL